MKQSTSQRLPTRWAPKPPLFAWLLALLLVCTGSLSAWADNIITPGITATPNSPVPGTNLTIALTYANTSPNNPNRIVDLTRVVTGLPIGLTGVTFTGTGATGATYNSGAGSVTFGGTNTLATGGTNLNFNIVIPVPLTGINSFNATSTPTPNTNQTTVNPTSVSVAVGAALPADVSATVSAPATAPAGSRVTFTLTLANTSGSNNATTVVAKLQLTAGLSNVSVSNFGVYDVGTGAVTFPARNLAPNEVFSPIVRVTMPASGTRVGTVTATSDLDPNAANNNGTASTATATVTATQVADVVISVNGPVAATPGSSIVYSVLLTNEGPSTATGVTAQLVLGGAPTGVAVTGGGTVAGSTVTFTTGGALASGTSQVYTVRFMVPATGPVTGTASAGSTTANGDPIAANNDGTAPASRVSTAVVSSTPSEVCANPGSGGSLTYTGTQGINTYYPGTANAAAGQNVVSIGTAVGSGNPAAPAALAVNDLVLLVQMQGADLNTTNTSSYGDGYAGDPGSGNLGSNFTAGQYEYGVVATVTGTTSFTLVANLLNVFQNADATATAGQRRFQVIRVPQYQNFTLSADLTTTPAWDGRTGGVLALDVASTLDMGTNRVINLVGKGFRGGAGRQLAGAGGYVGTDYRTPGTTTTNAAKGEGLAGTPRYVNNGGSTVTATDLGSTFGYPDGTAVGGGDNGRGAPGNAGGGGTDANPTTNDENTGGGGGSNGGTGGKGGNSWRTNLPYGGFGGAPYLQASPNRLVLGGGGGAGTTNDGTVDGTNAANLNIGGVTGNNVQPNGFASSGAAGGGIALLRAANVTGTGTVNVSGTDMTFVARNDGSGGGGAGGSVLLISNNTAAGALTGVTILATGGDGGSNTGAGEAHGPGGGGSGGVAFVSSAVNAASSFLPGTNGTTASVGAYEAAPGTSSPAFVRSNVGFKETPFVQSGANCVADVTTAISGPATVSPGAPAGPYTVTFTNNGRGTGTTIARVVTLPTGASLSTTQQNAILTAYPGTTFATTGTGAAAVTTITFPSVTSLANGASSAVVFSFTAPAAIGSVTLASSTGTGSNQGANLAPDAASFPITVGLRADVTTTLNGPTQLSTGQPAGPYTVTFANVGLAAAATVTRTVTLPAGATLTTAQLAAITAQGGTVTGQLIDFGNVTSLAAGASNGFTFSFTAPTTAGAAALASTTTTTSDEGANFAPNSSTLNTTVTDVADVAATIAPIAGTVNAGAAGAGFNVSFANNGTLTAAGVTRTVQLPAGLTAFGPVAATNGGTYDNATGLVTYVPSPTTLASGAPLTSAITFTAPPSGPVVATAQVSTTSPEAGQTANNTAAASLAVTPTFDLLTTIYGPATATQGNQVVLNVTTTNNGPSAAPNAVQTVQLIAGLANVFVSNNGTYDSGSGVVTFPALASLPAGQTAANTVSFTAPAPGTALAPVATVTPNTTGTGDSAPANNTAYLNGAGSSTSLTFVAPTALKANVFTKIRPSTRTVAAGAPLTLKVVTANAGPTAASNVVQQVQLLPGLTGTTFPAGATYNPATGLLTLPTLSNQPAGDSVAYTVSFPAPANAGNNGELLLTASVSTATSETVLADNVASAIVTVTPTADVATKVSGPANADAGQAVTYTATFANNGPGIATGVARTAQLPAGLASVVVTDAATGTAVSGAYNPTTGLVTLPPLASQPAGSSAAYTLTFAAPAASYAVSSATATTTADGVPANNRASTGTTVAPTADVAVALSGPAVAVIGTPVTYSVATTNNGPSPATGVATTLQLPANLTGVAVSGTGSYNSGSGLVTFEPTGTLASGASAVSFVTFTMPNAAGGQLSGVASATSTSADPVPANNSAGTATSVVQPTTSVADLATTVRAPAKAVAGAAMTITATFTNNGSGAALNVAPTLQLPAGLTVGAISNSGTYNPATGLVTWPLIASQASGNTATYTVALTAPATGPLRATSAVTSQTSDENLTNNAATTTTAITAAYDVVTSLSGPASSLPGAANTYTVTMTNNGPSAAPSAQPTVTLPSGVTATNISGGGTQAGTIISWPATTNQAPGTGGAVAYTFDVAMPAAGDLVLNAGATAAGESNTVNNGSTLTTTRANQPPVANNLMNAAQAPRGNTAIQLPVSPLFGTDADGTVATYRLTGSLPPTGQGVLFYNNNTDGTSGTYVALPIGQNLTPAQAGTLRFDPAAGYAGNVFYTYTATDNLGAVSNVATYGILVGADSPSAYASTPSKGGASKYVTGNVLAYVIDPNGAYYTSTGLVYDATTGARQSTASNGLPTTGTNAVLAPSGSGPAGNPTNVLPPGTALDPVTGQIFVSNASLLPRVTTATTYAVNVVTTDVFGGISTPTATFTLGAFPLPVELTRFEANAVKLDAVLTWATASEKNNDHFDVERSLNGTDFVKIGQVKGQGNSTAPTAYALTDAGIGTKGSGAVYYRLQQVDTDGTATYSPVRTVRFGQGLVPAFSVYPNPATAETTLDLTLLPAGSYRASVVDATGRVVLNVALEAGFAHPLRLTGLASGTYVVLLRGTSAGGAGLNFTQRLTKE